MIKARAEFLEYILFIIYQEFGERFTMEELKNIMKKHFDMPEDKVRAARLLSIITNTLRKKEIIESDFSTVRAADKWKIISNNRITQKGISIINAMSKKKKAKMMLLLNAYPQVLLQKGQ